MDIVIMAAGHGEQGAREAGRGWVLAVSCVRLCPVSLSPLCWSPAGCCAMGTLLAPQDPGGCTAVLLCLSHDSQRSWRV